MERIQLAVRLRHSDLIHLSPLSGDSQVIQSTSHCQIELNQPFNCLIDQVVLQEAISTGL